jgi:protein-disulfide isomerase
MVTGSVWRSLRVSLGLAVLWFGLAGCGTPPPVRDTASEPMALGRADAPLALVEFSDYQCPYCARFHAIVLPRLKSEYIDTGKLRLLFKDLPLSMHREALPAARAARCASAQGKFWPMNEALFANQRRLGPDLYDRLARGLALDVEAFTACLTNPLTEKMVQRDMNDARRLHINATPSFVLGRYDGERMQVVREAHGFVDFEILARELDAQLAAPAPSDHVVPK